MVTLERLRYFVAAAELQHVGNAARRLNISPSVISDAIGKLEEELGTKLFVREKNRLKINQNGRNLLVRANSILQATLNLAEGLKSVSPLSGRYRIGGSHFLMNQWLVPACLEVQKRCPQLSFEFVSLDTSMAVSHIISGLLDFAIVFKSSAAPTILEKVILQDQFCIIVRENHPLLRVRRPSLISELSKLPMASFRPSLGLNHWENHPSLTALGLSNQPAYYYDDTQIVVQILEETNAWAFVPSKVLASYSQLRSLPLTIKAPVNISWIYSKNTEDLRLMNLLQKEFET